MGCRIVSASCMNLVVPARLGLAPAQDGAVEPCSECKPLTHSLPPPLMGRGGRNFLYAGLVRLILINSRGLEGIERNFNL